MGFLSSVRICASCRGRCSRRSWRTRRLFDAVWLLCRCVVSEGMRKPTSVVFREVVEDPDYTSRGPKRRELRLHLAMARCVSRDRETFLLSYLFLPRSDADHSCSSEV